MTFSRARDWNRTCKPPQGEVKHSPRKFNEWTHRWKDRETGNTVTRIVLVSELLNWKIESRVKQSFNQWTYSIGIWIEKKRRVKRFTSKVKWMKIQIDGQIHRKDGRMEKSFKTSKNSFNVQLSIRNAIDQTPKCVWHKK